MITYTVITIKFVVISTPKYHETHLGFGQLTHFLDQSYYSLVILIVNYVTITLDWWYYQVD